MLLSYVKNLGPWILALFIVWIFQGFIAQNIDTYFLTIVAYSGIAIIMAASLNLITGITGQFSMGHAGFMSVGAYASTVLSMYFMESNPTLFTEGSLMTSLLFLSALLFGGLIAAIIGYGVGLPSLRLKGDYLAIVTLGFGEVIRVMILNIDSIGGPRGIPNIPYLSNVGWIYTFVVVTLFVLWRTVYSPVGREFLSVREDEIAAEAMGVNATRAKVRAFVLSSFFAGIAGGLLAHFLRYINPAMFDFNKSFEIIIMVVLGGMGSFAGSVFAAVLLTFMREALRPLQEYTQVDFRMVIYSLFLIILMLTRPRGIFGRKELKDIFSFRKAAKS